MAPRSTSSTSSDNKDETVITKSNVPFQDFIHLRHAPAASDAAAKTKYLIFMITGNPGLIEYYRDFLGCLNDQLGQTTEDVEFEFYGRSLGGFEINGATSNEKSGNTAKQHNSYYDLNGQVEYLENHLSERVEQITNEMYGQRPKVILIGHSVGSYLLLELVQRHRRRLEPTTKDEKANGQTSTTRTEPDIVSGICLFPTIVDIGKSPQGQIFISLSRIPLFPSLVSTFTCALTSVFPSCLLHSLVGSITGMPTRPAGVTSAFLSSRTGVHQALYMGADEMRSITADRWDEEIWGAAHPSLSGVERPQLFFYFAKEDHWVAGRTRDEVMALRGRSAMGDKDEWRPWMEVDELGVPHGFCINHSAQVANKCTEFIKLVIVRDRDTKKP